MGGAPCTVLGSEDTSTENPASAQTLALQKIQKNSPKPANPLATGQEGTLAHLPKLTSVTIPESITAITSDTFADCPQLATITVAPNNPTYASIDGLLYNKALTRVLLCPESAEGVVSLPDQTDAVPASALSHCANLSTLLVGQDNVAYTSINGNLYSKDASTLIACPGGIGETLTLPKQTTTIGSDALAGITTLKSIVVLGTITAIDPTAFNDQSKQSITIALPGGEDYETRKAVWESAGFKNFATPANPGDTQTPDQPSNPGDNPDNPTDPSKPASGFSYKLLPDYTLEASWTGELSPTSNPTIPTTAQLAGLSYTVSALAPKAFAGTALTAIDIPATITTIGDQAFANCPNLTRIITHTNTIQVAPTALEACTNLELWCPYNEAETYPWTIGLFATNNHIKAYGLPASQQALALEVGQSANLFEPGTLQAPDPSKTVYAYEATCLAVSQEGTITAKAPGTTTISTSIELEEIPLTHTTRTISVEAPSTPITPEQPETPTPPNAQPITPRYPPNLATPTQASAPLYSRGGIQPRAYVPKVSVTVPTAPIISINAAGERTTTPVDITSTTAEPIRAAKITCTELSGAEKLLPDLGDKSEKPDVRANTKVTVEELASNQLEFALSKTPPARWDAPEDASAPFRIEANSSIPITFGLTIPNNATYSYLPKEGADFAQVEFTFDRLAPMTTGLNLTSTGTLTDPKVGDILSVAPIEPVSHSNPAVYTWYERDSKGDTTTFTPNVSLTSHKLADTQKDKSIYCALSDGAMVNPETWHYSPVYSEETGKVAAGWPPSLKDFSTLEEYSWAELRDVADYLSQHVGVTTDPVFIKFDGFMKQNIENKREAGAKKSLGINVTINSQPVPLNVRIIGINHDAVEIDAQGKATKTAGLTFMTDYAVPDCDSVMNSSSTNEGGWAASDMCKTTMAENGTVWKKLEGAKSPTTADNPTPYIKEVLKDNKKGISPTTDKLFLLSNQEIIGSDWISGEGTQYPFFAGIALNNDGNPNPILRFGIYWWERSSLPNNSNYFVLCNTSGYPSTASGASDSYGVAPGFSL